MYFSHLQNWKNKLIFDYYILSVVFYLLEYYYILILTYFLSNAFGSWYDS